MKELKFLDSYSGQTLDEIIGLESEYRIDSLVMVIEQALLRKSRLTNPEQTIRAVESLEREVNNGGYEPFFFNSSRCFAPIVVRALQAIGCPKTAAITQRAIDALRISVPLTEESIRVAIEQDNDSRTEVFSECNHSYYEGKDEPIAEKLFAYIKANRAEIRLDAL